MLTQPNAEGTLWEGVSLPRSPHRSHQFLLGGINLDTDPPTLREEQSATSPGPFSQNWKKDRERLKSLSPRWERDLG